MILITGATGTIGRELAQELHERGAEFRALVRDPDRAVDLPWSAERVVGDLDEPATLTHAFDGVEALFVLTPGIDSTHTAHAVAAAGAAGVGRVVLLSSSFVSGDDMPAMGRHHHEREQLVRDSGIPATVLRSGGFMTEALEWAATIREEGYVLDPVGPGRHAPVDPADVAAVAALALTEDGHQGQEYVLTGEEAFTIVEQVRILSRVIGRDIAVRAVDTPDEAIRLRFPDGLPQAVADVIAEAFAHVRADTVGLRTDTVERLLGRKPRSFEEWCARNASAFLD
ncbi:NAD(P)H-binding protein [Kitasatospora sp. SUK 42]|uniref:NAD(P)H-binding protein n=1 Tax=Kitasatospora sp. SUK 42 TaxID=1588882 RepID=UPI001C317475|nr:NAD(P)H-binding protein [Kitasatospora sp. SUK 42]MBV2155607.1 NAD(P)H-binding protein [Kitasatospora sp. SUK 42]